MGSTLYYFTTYKRILIVYLRYDTFSFFFDFDFQLQLIAKFFFFLLLALLYFCTCLFVCISTCTLFVTNNYRID